MEPARIPLDRLTWARWRHAMRDLTRSEIGARVKTLVAIGRVAFIGALARFRRSVSLA